MEKLLMLILPYHDPLKIFNHVYLKHFQLLLILLLNKLKLILLLDGKILNWEIFLKIQLNDLILNNLNLIIVIIINIIIITCIKAFNFELIIIKKIN